MKRLLLIICLLPVLAFGQFSGAKKLLLQQECQYDLSSYPAYTYFNYYYESSVCSIPPTTINSLISAKQALDNIRNCGPLNCTRGFHLGYFNSYPPLTVGKTIIMGSFENGIHPICESFPSGDFWGFATVSNFDVGTVPIVHIENGIITYLERY